MTGEIVTPDLIISELRMINAEAERGPDAIYQAELRFDAAESDHQNIYDLAYFKATGTGPLRDIQAREAAADALAVMKAEKAVLNRIKAKVKKLEAGQSNLQTQSKLITVMYQGAGS